MDASLTTYLAIFAVAVLAHEPWRWLGAYLGHSLSPDDEIFRWVKAVSTALVAGLVMRLVLFPAGALEGVALSVRVAALVVGVATFLLTGRHMLAGIGAGCIAVAIGGFLVPGA